MSWKKTAELMDTIRHYASFPATGVGLRQMVQFGERPSTSKPLEQCSSFRHGSNQSDSRSQAPSSELPSSSRRSSPFTLRTACRSLSICLTVWTRCRQ